MSLSGRPSWGSSKGGVQKPQLKQRRPLEKEDVAGFCFITNNETWPVCCKTGVMGLPVHQPVATQQTRSPERARFSLRHPPRTKSLPVGNRVRVALLWRDL